MDRSRTGAADQPQVRQAPRRALRVWALTLGLFPGLVHALPVIPDHFTRLSPGEIIDAPFTSASGVSSTQGYGAWVEVIVTGSGYSNGLNRNDAFYCTAAVDPRCAAPGTVMDPQFYQLNIGFTGLPFDGEEANNIDQFIRFIDGIGPVTPPALPAYDGLGHRYHFVVNLPLAAPSLLAFGVADILYADNGGDYRLQLFSLAPKALPEPGGLMLAMLGLAAMWRQSKTTRPRAASAHKNETGAGTRLT